MKNAKKVATSQNNTKDFSTLVEMQQQQIDKLLAMQVTMGKKIGELTNAMNIALKSSQKPVTTKVVKSKKSVATKVAKAKAKVQPKVEKLSKVENVKAKALPKVERETLKNLKSETYMPKAYKIKSLIHKLSFALANEKKKSAIKFATELDSYLAKQDKRFSIIVSNDTIDIMLNNKLCLSIKQRNEAKRWAVITPAMAEKMLSSDNIYC